MSKKSRQAAESAKTLGEFIRARREELGISLRACAASIRISPAFLSDIELGRRFPSKATRKLLSQALGTTPEELEDCEQFSRRFPVEKLMQMADADLDMRSVLWSLVNKEVSGTKAHYLIQDWLSEIASAVRAREAYNGR